MQTDTIHKQNDSQRGQVRLVVLGATFLALGAALATLWFTFAQKHGSQATTISLSDSTKSVLKSLNSPVEIRFYSLLDTSSVPSTVTAFSERIGQLLAAYQQEAGAKLVLKKVDTQSTTAADAASADGIRPFNLDKGDACYLGIAISAGGKKETLPTLAPEWESALESDLSRAISRIVTSIQPAPVAPTAQTAAAEESVKASVPNYQTVPLAQGRQMIQAKALSELQEFSRDIEPKLKAAQDRLLQAQNDNSESAREAALAEIQQLQAQQMAKLKEVAAKSKAQTEALERLQQSAK